MTRLGVLILTLATSAVMAAGQTDNSKDRVDIMQNQQRILELKSRIVENMTEITVKAESGAPIDVTYKLAVKSQSTTRHSGRTRILQGPAQTLSRVRVHNDGRWCAILDVEQSNGVAYRLTEGSC